MNSPSSQLEGSQSGRPIRRSGKRPLQVLLAFAAAVGIGGCGSVQSTYPLAPRTADAPNLRYKIGALDALNVVVWRNPELTTIVTVRPDGLVSIPLVEDLQAAGKTPAELAREVEKSLAKLIRDPVVSIIVNTFQGVYSEQVRIVGEAARPQAVAYRQNMTILDLMIHVGGLTDFADGNGAVLIRGVEGGKQYGLRLKDLLKRGDIAANAAVLPGDIIIVPQSWF